MIDKHNQKKKDLLGMAHGTASGKLRKAILFDMVVKANLHFCFRYTWPILKIEEFSIEHKEAWMSAKDPIQAFFNLDNIAFSHYICNVQAASKPHKKFSDENERSRANFKIYYDKNKKAILNRRKVKRGKANPL